MPSESEQKIDLIIIIVVTEQSTLNMKAKRKIARIDLLIIIHKIYWSDGLVLL